MVRCFLGELGAQVMGFDPRQWSPHRDMASWSRSTSGQRVTSNVEAILRENDALRREVKRLQQELERARRSQWQQPSAHAPARISSEQVQAWGAALARQPGWSQLRQGALELLIDQLNRNSFPSRLSLQQRLDRLVSGLGTDLLAAVGPRTTKKTVAVMAAFALYGVRASEWLDEDPARVVSELHQRQTHSSRRQTEANRRQTRRTRSDRRTTDREPSAAAVSEEEQALAVLGLQVGATQEQIKQAFRRLVKRHHPDVGGSAHAFRRVNEAYQQLTA